MAHSRCTRSLWLYRYFPHYQQFLVQYARSGRSVTWWIPLFLCGSRTVFVERPYTTRRVSLVTGEFSKKAITTMNIPFNNSYVKLPERFYARVHPATVPAPSLIKANERLAKTLSIDANWLQSKEGVSMLAGNKLPDNADPIAMVYAAHQFGGWVPQLGDGRAILLGEVIGTDGVRYDIQLKGSGITPFSRQGDGKAAIGPVLREYIVSEAMHVLGVPTTRSLAAVLTGETVMRDQILQGDTYPCGTKSCTRGDIPIFLCP